jgi:hypothetical protein
MRDSLPDNLYIDVEVSVNQAVAHANDVWPGNVWVTSQQVTALTASLSSVAMRSCKLCGSGLTSGSNHLTQTWVSSRIISARPSPLPGKLG